MKIKILEIYEYCSCGANRILTRKADAYYLSFGLDGVLFRIVGCVDGILTLAKERKICACGICQEDLREADCEEDGEITYYVADCLRK